MFNENQDDAESLERLDETLRQSPQSMVDQSIASPQTIDALRLLNSVFRQFAESAADVEPLPTSIGRYEVRRELGRGRFGIVYEAYDTRLNRVVAIKRIRPERLDDADVRRRFAHEAEIVAALQHPGIVPLLDAGLEGAIWYIVFAFCEGSNLEQWRAAQPAGVAPRTAAHIIYQLADAVEFGHRHGIVHRDLKPSNVMMVPNADSPIGYDAKLLDFGFARSLNAELRQTASSVLVGTPLYMAPEQSEGAGAIIGPQTDLFSLGAIFYELLAGQPPFRGATIYELLKQLQICRPPAINGLPTQDACLESICRRCLRLRPQDRYASAQELSVELERYLDGKCIAFRSAKLRSLVSVIAVCVAATATVQTLWQSAEPRRDPLPMTETVERAIATKVIELGGSVDVAFAGRSVETDKLESLPDVPFEVIWIMLPRCKNVTDTFLHSLELLHGLVGLDLYATSITDRSCEAIARVPTLKNVYLHSTAITDVGAAAILRLPHLEEINCSWTAITDLTLEKLSDRDGLRLLRIRDTRISDRGLLRLRGLRFLETLDIGENMISDQGFLPLASHLTVVRELRIDGTKIGDQGLTATRRWPLKLLKCSLAYITDEGLQAFRGDHADCYVQVD